MLETIGNRDIPIPNHIDIFHLKNEMEASDKTALQCVMEVDEERTRLEAEAAELTRLGDEGSERYKVSYSVWCTVSFTTSSFHTV